VPDASQYASRFRRKFGVEDELGRYVTALYDMLGSVLGPDKVVLRAGKVNALRMMRSANLPDRLCALQRLVLEDPTLERATTRAQQRKAIAEIEDAMAETMAQRNAEDALEKRVNEKMSQRHEEYVKDLKLEALRESGGPETPSTQAKLAELEALSQRGLAASALRQLRPQNLRDIVGQEAAVRALLAKISSPYPQHVLLYGPPATIAVCQKCAVR
jgi:ATP-dependent Lon protease